MCPVQSVLPLVLTVHSCRRRRRRSPARLKPLALNWGAGRDTGVSRGSGRCSAALPSTGLCRAPVAPSACGSERRAALGGGGSPGPGAGWRVGQPGAGAAAIGTRLLFCVRVPPPLQDLGAFISPLLGATGLLTHIEKFKHSANHINTCDCGKRGIKTLKEKNTIPFSFPLGRIQSCTYSACIHTGPSTGADPAPVTVLIL